MIKYKVEGDLFKFVECNSFYQDIIQLLDQNEDIEIDFRFVNYFSSTAIGILFSLNEKIKNKSVKLFIKNINDDVKKTLLQFGVNQAKLKIDIQGINED